MKITLKDIFDACLTVPEGMNYPDTGISLSLIEEDDEEGKYAKNSLFDNVFPRFIKTDDYFEIDFIFASNKDMKLDGMMAMVDKWQESLMSDSPKSLQVGIIPFKYKCKYYINAENPVLFALSSDKPEVYPHILKFVFEEEDVEIIENDADYEDMMAEIKKEMNKEARLMLEEQKRIEQEEYEAFHNDLIGG